MSRIGKAPIAVPSGVNVTVADNIVTVKGPKGELKQNIHPEIQVNIADGQINVERPSDEKQFRATCWGWLSCHFYRSSFGACIRVFAPHPF